jgi:hypothetical protein
LHEYKLETMDRITIMKGISALAIGYLLYITISCPCKELYSCHCYRFWIAMGIIALIYIVENHLVTQNQGGS